MRLLRGQNRSRHLATVLVRCEKLAERADEVWLGNDLVGKPSPGADVAGNSPIPVRDLLAHAAHDGQKLIVGAPALDALSHQWVLPHEHPLAHLH